MLIDSYAKKLIELSLKEDIRSGDITSSLLLSKGKKAGFTIILRQDAVICGMAIAEACFETVDGSIRFKPLVMDGSHAVCGKALAYIEGNAISVLSAERTALNFLSWLSGISTLTDEFVRLVNHTKALIMDTRKTIPTLRKLQKYAVKAGGGTNHRMGLYDQVLIKDNHIALAFDKPVLMEQKKDIIRGLLKNAGQKALKNAKIEVEVDSLDILDVVLEAGPDIIMLDNMDIDSIAKAVTMRDSYRIKKGDVGFKSLIEVSGNVNLSNVRSIAECGVDRISIGALTHSPKAVDISLEVR
jgi:nicotinate-nucleotide pyrophosphorylase (carboxylating)